MRRGDTAGRVSGESARRSPRATAREIGWDENKSENPAVLKACEATVNAHAMIAPVAFVEALPE
jgi:hypothetical protein